MEKRCASCGESKKLSEFRKLKIGLFGVGYKCRECQSLIDAEYRKRPARKESVSKYCRSAKHKINVDKWRSKNPEKRKAHEHLNNAIVVGKVQPQPCVFCGSKAQGHHDDYSKPFEVTWLCAMHHKEHHRRIANER